MDEVAALANWHRFVKRNGSAAVVGLKLDEFSRELVLSVSVQFGAKVLKGSSRR